MPDGDHLVDLVVLDQRTAPQPGAVRWPRPRGRATRRRHHCGQTCARTVVQGRCAGPAWAGRWRVPGPPARASGAVLVEHHDVHAGDGVVGVDQAGQVRRCPRHSGSASSSTRSKGRPWAAASRRVLSAAAAVSAAVTVSVPAAQVVLERRRGRRRCRRRGRAARGRWCAGGLRCRWPARSGIVAPEGAALRRARCRRRWCRPSPRRAGGRSPGRGRCRRSVRVVEASAWVNGSKSRVGVRGGDADAGVGDLEADAPAHPVAGAVGDQVRAYGDLALRGELDRVAGEVEQDLAEPAGSPRSVVGRSGPRRIDQLQALAAGASARPARRPRRRRVAGRSRPSRARACRPRSWRSRGCR